MKLEVLSKTGQVRAMKEGAGLLYLVYAGRYRKGDTLVFTPDAPGFYRLRLEDTLPPSLVYVKDRAVLPVPFGRMDRTRYSPRAFQGVQHLLCAAAAAPEEAAVRRNLALNPLDSHQNGGMFPHASANIETRGWALFAAQNAIDGLHANWRHYPYPFQSWGSGQDGGAAWELDFGVPVVLDELVVTLRADVPHDSFWTSGLVTFSDGSKQVLDFQPTGGAQRFPLAPRTVTGLRLSDLAAPADGKGFCALRQLEAWGVPQLKQDQ